MMMIVFITLKNVLVPLIEGTCAQIYHFGFEIIMSIMYQRMETMLTTELLDHGTLQFVCNKVATAGLRSLNLPVVQPPEGHSILTDVLLTPVHMGGAGMENPTSRHCQDLSIGILSGFGTSCACSAENLRLNDELDCRLLHRRR